MLALYMYKTEDGRYLASMDTKDDAGTPMLGAVIPGEDGNYYNHLHIFVQKEKAKFKLGAEGWLEWVVTEGLPLGHIRIEEDFEFDPKTVKIVELKE